MASRDTEVGGRTEGQSLTMALNRRSSFVILEGAALDAIVVETEGICRWENGRCWTLEERISFQVGVHSFSRVWHE